MANATIRVLLGDVVLAEVNHDLPDTFGVVSHHEGQELDLIIDPRGPGADAFLAELAEEPAPAPSLWRRLVGA
jgi:hypothetical protein